MAHGCVGLVVLEEDVRLAVVYLNGILFVVPSYFLLNRSMVAIFGN